MIVLVHTLDHGISFHMYVQHVDQPIANALTSVHGKTDLGITRAIAMVYNANCVQKKGTHQFVVISIIIQGYRHGSTPEVQRKLAKKQFDKHWTMNYYTKVNRTELFNNLVTNKKTLFTTALLHCFVTFTLSRGNIDQLRIINEC